ncbi:hypothetical protein J4Q44_G00176110 [Coregonus suidteri]|uniref:Neurotransmitter-gated ion-channel transmembrane domain-containing protein n=1 Tax=Coregonus suidteri TaxID=861788 RepID=A0AAN8R3W6_9TELE
MSTLWLLCSLALMGGVSTMEDCSYRRLQDHLGLSQKNEITTGLRPVVHWTNSTQVMVDMILFGIMDLNEKSSTFTSYVLISTITLRRRPLLYIINLVVPIAFFLVLDLGSFFISEAKGEKLGFKVTILLSISVLLLILNDILPSTANSLPVIALYLTGLSLLETMLVSFLIYMDSRVDQNIQTSAKTCEETQEETDCQRVPERDAESSLEKVDTLNKKDLDEDWLNNPHLLQLILEEVQNVRQEWFSVNLAYWFNYTEKDPLKRRL